MHLKPGCTMKHTPANALVLTADTVRTNLKFLNHWTCLISSSLINLTSCRDFHMSNGVIIWMVWRLTLPRRFEEFLVYHQLWTMPQEQRQHWINVTHCAENIVSTGKYKKVQKGWKVKWQSQNKMWKMPRDWMLD